MPPESVSIGYLVAIWNPHTQRWEEDWDGTVHATLEEAQASATEAAGQSYRGDGGTGYTVVVVKLVPVEAVRVGSDGGPR